jgi:glycosyltransferase involved in cell wall biosynthesis
LPSKDLGLFLELAKRLPEHRCVLAAVTCKEQERYIEEIKEQARRSGTRAEVHFDLPRAEIASLVGRAGIYVHTARIEGQSHATPIGGPMSIAEAMATGAHVLVRDAPSLVDYVGDAGVPYRDVDHAAAIIRGTEAWSDAEWREAWRRSVDRAFFRHADELALRPVFEDWVHILQSERARSDRGGHGADYRLVSASGGVDAQWYLERYADVAASGVDPIAHYLERGWREGRDPSPRFSTSGYLAANRDVAQAACNPLVHYLRYGQREGRSFSARPASPRNVPGRSMVSAAFDRRFYLVRNPDVAGTGMDPVDHYLEQGAREGRDPTPEFVTSYYVSRYPDVMQSGLNPFAHYLEIGRREGRSPSPLSAGDPTFDALCEMLRLTPSDVAATLAERRRDVRERLESGILGQMVARAGELEPLVHQSSAAAMRTGFPPFTADHMALVVAMHRLQTAANWQRARAVVVTRASETRGYARVAGHLARALAELYGPDEIVVVLTESSRVFARGWFPDGCRFVDFAGAAEELPAQSQERLLVEFLRSLRPAAVFNVHSAVLWRAMSPFGSALAFSTALYAYLFCSNLDAHGYQIGYPVTHFYRHFDLFRAVVTDSHHLADELRARFQIPPGQTGKLVAVETPVTEAISLAPWPSQSADRRRQVFWAGRLDRQKRVDVVMSLASRMPDVDFRVWGEPVVDGVDGQLRIPGNVLMEGVYKEFTQLPLERCDAWLYTSQWDGVGTILLDVVAAGIPLVGPLAGGTGEVLLEGLCHRIAGVEDVDGFERAIREVLDDPPAARARASELREVLRARRAPAVYREAVRELLAADGIE